MSRPLSIFSIETAEELKQWMQAQQKAKLKERLQALYLLKQGRAKTLKDIADLLGRSRSTIEYWVARYSTEGLLGVCAWNYRGGPPPAIPEPGLAELREQLSQPHGVKS